MFCSPVDECKQWMHEYEVLNLNSQGVCLHHHEYGWTVHLQWHCASTSSSTSTSSFSFLLCCHVLFLIPCFMTFPLSPPPTFFFFISFYFFFYFLFSLNNVNFRFWIGIIFLERNWRFKTQAATPLGVIRQWGNIEKTRLLSKEMKRNEQKWEEARRKD